MEKVYRTLTYGKSAKLKLDVQPKRNFGLASGVEVFAKVDTETGEVKFFVDKNDLKKLND